ncbi:hypothetical protein [Actinoplanes sp. GCM10030250]|uniref:hypothetical protein n=1 Tax=Actinoplanes sp. GCM10030250 TaxID=3273376 RepID=UPI00361DD6F7
MRAGAGLSRRLTAAVTLAGFLGAAYLFADSRGPAAVPAPVAAAPSPVAYHSDGLSDAYDGFRAEPLTLPTGRGTGTVSVRVTGPAGTATDFQQVHTKQMHMYVLRDDLSGYQHLHPEVVDGAWTAPVTITDGGAYRVYLEFVPHGRPAAGPTGAEPTVLGIPFVIAGDTTMVPVPAPRERARSGPYTVRRLDGTADLASGTPAALQFQVLRDGRPAVLEPYLGAYAHLSNFEVRTQGLKHLHPLPADANGGAPADGVLAFHAAFAERGDKRLFLQFRAGGGVHQVAFTLFTT